MANEVVEFERKYADIEDEDLSDLLPSSVSLRLKSIPDEIWNLSETEMKKAGKINETDIRLRVAFWLEYERAKRTGKDMMAANIYAGTCTQGFFLKEVITNSYKLAFIATPPVEVQIGLEEILLMGLDQMREIMQLPNRNEKGFVDARLIDVKRKIFEDVANRRRGHVLRKTEVNTKNLNVSLTGEVPPAQKLEDIDARLAELEQTSLPAPQAHRDIVEQVQALDVEVPEEL